MNNVLSINNADLYTVTQIAEMFNVSLVTIRRYIRSKRLQASKVGTEFLVTGSDLKLFFGIVEDSVIPSSVEEGIIQIVNTLCQETLTKHNNVIIKDENDKKVWKKTSQLLENAITEIFNLAELEVISTASPLEELQNKFHISVVVRVKEETEPTLLRFYMSGVGLLKSDPSVKNVEPEEPVVEIKEEDHTVDMFPADPTPSITSEKKKKRVKVPVEESPLSTKDQYNSEGYIHTDLHVG